MTGDEMKIWMADRNLKLMTVAVALGVSRRGVARWSAEGPPKRVAIARNAVFPLGSDE